MLWNVIARAGAGLAVAALVFSGGCRSVKTDRIRVLEAKNATAEKEMAELRQRNAELRAKELEAQAARDRAEAEARAAEARATIAAQKAPAAAPPATGEKPGRISVDTSGLRDIPGVEVRSGKNGETTITLASDVTFKPGRADLSTKSQATLEKVALALRNASGVREVRIEGHTDSDPIRKSGWKDNRHLSVERASTVRRFLVTKGLDDAVVHVEGHGADRPLAPNTSDTGKAQNRRVEIILIAQS